MQDTCHHDEQPPDGVEGELPAWKVPSAGVLQAVDAVLLEAGVGSVSRAYVGQRPTLGAIRRLQVTNRRLPVGHRTGTSPNFCRSASLIWSITASRKPLCGADERMPDFA
jgi:hypothetical protein